MRGAPLPPAGRTRAPAASWKGPPCPIVPCPPPGLLGSCSAARHEAAPSSFALQFAQFGCISGAGRAAGWALRPPMQIVAGCHRPACFPAPAPFSPCPRGLEDRGPAPPGVPPDPHPVSSAPAPEAPEAPAAGAAGPRLGRAQRKPSAGRRPGEESGFSWLVVRLSIKSILLAAEFTDPGSSPAGPACITALLLPDGRTPAPSPAPRRPRPRARAPPRLCSRGPTRGAPTRSHRAPGEGPRESPRGENGPGASASLGPSGGPRPPSCRCGRGRVPAGEASWPPPPPGARRAGALQLSQPRGGVQPPRSDSPRPLSTQVGPSPPPAPEGQPWALAMPPAGPWGRGGRGVLVCDQGGRSVTWAGGGLLISEFWGLHAGRTEQLMEAAGV